MSLIHYVDNSIINREHTVLLVGAGGTGSQLVTGLARMNHALRDLGGPGYRLIVADGDSVSPSNVGRQLFSEADVGRKKSVVLVNRVNMFFGTNWEAFPHNLKKDTRYSRVDLMVSAVDNVETRTMLSQNAKMNNVRYWMDTGNASTTGQVILGTIKSISQPNKQSPSYLPTVLDLYQDILEKESKEAYQGPSCSMAEALSRQDLFVNQWVATCALEILWKMYRYGQLRNHGAFINLVLSSVRPLPVNPETWKTMGWKKPRSTK